VEIFAKGILFADVRRKFLHKEMMPGCFDRLLDRDLVYCYLDRLIRSYGVIKFN
jgi:hypothetical protein